MGGSSRLDHVYRNLVLSKFFVRGWGHGEDIKRLFDFRKNVCDREKCQTLVDRHHPVTIDKEEDHKSFKLLRGHFDSPFAQHLPGLVPKESETAHFEMLIPKKWTWENNMKPMVIQLAGTGDHYFWRRRLLMAKPMLNESNIGSIILENPFYGVRKPKEQKRSSLHNVSDIFVMGGCLILESLVLFHWCERNGLGPLGITGISMGGHMASLAASSWPKPVVLVPCLSWSTASGVFTRGVMSGAIDWSLLENQYRSNDIYNEILKMILHSPRGDCAFEAGKQFAQNYSRGIRDEEDGKAQATTNPSYEVSSEQRLQSAVQETFQFEKGQAIDPPASVWAKFWSVFQGANAYSLSLSGLSSWQRLLPPIRLSDRGWNGLEKAHARQEALQFMRGIMDEFTHIANFTQPVDCSCIIIVTARDDAYVPRDGTTDLSQLWPGSEIRYLPTGHVGAYVLHHPIFRRAVKDAFDRLISRHGNQ